VTKTQLEVSLSEFQTNINNTFLSQQSAIDLYAEKKNLSTLAGAYYQYGLKVNSNNELVTD
jgi:hypothetical protein